MRLIQPIIIIGGGNMGSALATRWHVARIGPIHVIEPDESRHRELTLKGITCHTKIQDAPKKSSVIVLAVKPQQFASLAADLKEIATQGSTLFLSIIAGVTLETLHQISQHSARVMPNLPAMVGESMSVAFAPNLDTLSQKVVVHLFETVGKLAWVKDEALLHVATAVSGSGPGYVFAFMESLEEAAVAQGLNPELAHQLVRQTFRGASMLAEQSHSSVAKLRENVTSPGGTTEAALNIFTKGNLSPMIKEAVCAATKRSQELSE